MGIRGRRRRRRRREREKAGEGVGGAEAVMTAVAFSMAYKSLWVVVAAFWKSPSFSCLLCLPAPLSPSVFLIPLLSSPLYPPSFSFSIQPKGCHMFLSASSSLSLSPPNSPTVRCFASLLTYPSLCLHFPWTWQYPIGSS
jgi:hypothetical protein